MPKYFFIVHLLSNGDITKHYEIYNMNHNLAFSYVEIMLKKNEDEINERKLRQNGKRIKS